MRKGIYKNILKPRIKSFISSMSSGEQVEWNDEHGIPMKTDSDDYDYVLQPNIYKTKLVNANYTITIEDIKTNVTLVVNTTSAEIVLTLPAKSVIPDNGYIWAFNIVHRVGTNNVKVQCDGTEKFIFGNSYFNLGSHLFMFTIGCSNLDGTTSWGILRNITIRGSFHRDAAWAASNFSSVTIVPFDSEEYNNNDEILVYTAGASSRITIKTAGSYKISYNMSIDSTGGITWNATSSRINWSSKNCGFYVGFVSNGRV